MTKEKFKQNIGVVIFIIALWMLMIRQLSAMMSIVPYFSWIAIVYGNKILWLGILLLAIVIICNRPMIFEIIGCMI